MIVVMGVAGAGKSLIGELLAARLGASFVEGDQLHPPANVEKMSAGTPLTDDDRWPWLDTVGREMRDRQRGGANVVAACSALKKVYRDALRTAAAAPDMLFVYLRAEPGVIAARMAERAGHFMPPSLLQSQLATLEEPSDADERAITIDNAQSPDEVVAHILGKLDS